MILKECEKTFHNVTFRLFNRKRAAFGFFFGVLSFSACLLTGWGFLFALLAFALIFALSSIRIRFLHPAAAALAGVILAVASGFSIFLIMHFMLVKGFSISVPWKEVICNVLLYLGVFLLFFLISGHFAFSVILSSTILMLLGIANDYVYSFRGGELTPLDFMSLRTAANVVGSYSLLPNRWVVFALIGLVCNDFAVTVLDLRGISKKLWIRFAALICLLSSAFCIHRIVRNIQGTHWKDFGTRYHGFWVSFAINFRQLAIPVPAGYSEETIERMESQYPADTATDTTAEQYPDVIVIMSESFADFSIYGSNFQCSEDPIPFYHSLRGNAITGYALASVFGGNTANSEYEFLTGNTMAFLPSGSVPYQQYIHADTYNLVRVLKSLGYYSIATHPYVASGWSRPSVYRYFGFDELHFEESYSDPGRVRQYVSDESFCDNIISQYNSAKSHGPVFMHCISMQNHGPYDYQGTDFQNTITITNAQQSYPLAEQYLSLLRLTDKSIEQLIRYFETEDRDVILVFFGDHQPRIEPSYYELLHGGAFNTLDEMMLQYMVPFFVWTNYETDTTYDVSCTSLNYLSNYIFEVSDIPMSRYNRFLSESESQIPRINALGYYSASANGYLSLAKAAGKELELINSYQILQYNSIFRQKSLSSIFLDYMAATSDDD